VDVINCAEFFIDRFRGVDFVGVEICLSPEELEVAVNTVRSDCDISRSINDHKRRSM